MKRFYLVLMLLAGILAAPGQSADEFYVRIYSTIQDADAFALNLQHAAALQKYREAQTALERFLKGNPDWNPSIIKFRLAYVGERNAALTPKVPAAQAQTAADPKAAPTQDAVQTATAVAAENQQNTLREQVRALQADRVRLEAKLREALAVQPAAVDPRELAKAEQRAQDLQKEIELLKVSLEQAKARPAADPASAESKKAGEDSRRQLQEQAERIQTLEVEKSALQERLKKQSEPAVDPAEVEKLRQNVAEQKQTIAKLQSEQQSLRERLKKETESRIDPAEVEKLRATMAEQKSTIERLQTEQQSLRDGLAAATAQKADADKLAALEKQTADLKSRLAAFDAKAVPFTPEELALLNKPQPALAAPPAPAQPESAKPARTPAAAAAMAALTKEAQTLFAAGKLEQAEAKFAEALGQDPTDVVTLGNLATVELEMNKLEAAEQHINQALTVAPQDVFTLAALGRLRWQQKRFDDALTALSRAADIDPKNAEVQNYLGLVLSEKGQRPAAESALRKAIQLRPGYGSAHQNLAVVYLSQDPPMVELARFHYKRSLTAGAPANPQLEKLIEAKSKTP